MTSVKQAPSFSCLKSNDRPEVRATIKEEKEEGKTKHEKVNK
jgi:hypothetical protein